MQYHGLWVPAKRRMPTTITAFLDESEDENRPRNERVSAIGESPLTKTSTLALEEVLTPAAKST